MFRGLIRFVIWTIIALPAAIPTGAATATASESSAHPNAMAVEEADFREAQVGLNETPASFEEDTPVFGEETGVSSSSGPAPDASSALASEPTGPIRHAAHYLPPQHYPERQPRALQQVNHTWLLPLFLIAGVAALVTAGSKKRSRTPNRLRRSAQLLILASIVGIVAAGSARALRYSSVKDAVMSSLGRGQKIFQRHILITPEIHSQLQKDLGWAPKQRVYKVYYVKGKNGTPQRYAFILSDRLAICGGLHKYCVTIDAVGRVADVRILELTCDRSYCINTRLFLSQFKEFDVHNHGRKAKGYDAISGATQSTDLTRDIVRRALMLYHIGKAQESHG
jgi:hypothetical protein